ncbi:molybdenum cofactor biosynthesis protein MoaE [Actinomyces sp. 2119]|uniref:Molybdenum cofactor biosynthesis protein MoaE n=1 Tax=Actinomyces lilanjuaniae TaxID=2321394 RepID=A0ABN5PSC6_9ACTO|nr:molybdenum cofactor biosynthesis protein MoaE [Actinomyces lilanjuaniae]RJF43264.1 molybdenum cofactor biosynthesis protein MoaE [Actinomyces sp. 2119]
MVRAEVTTAPVSVTDLADLVEDPAAGALVTFTGVIRNHDGGRGVTGIHYACHPTAGDVIARIATEAGVRHSVRALAVVHRVGDLVVGDTALAVAVSADHRGPAFAALSELVEEVKRSLPVWKHQRFADGTAQWSNLG